jgi:hypothetical protein
MLTPGPWNFEAQPVPSGSGDGVPAGTPRWRRSWRAAMWAAILTFLIATLGYFLLEDPWRKVRVCLDGGDARCFFSTISVLLHHEVEDQVVKTSAWGYDLAHAAFHTGMDGYLTDLLINRTTVNAHAKIALRELTYLSLKARKVEQARELWDAMSRLSVEKPDLDYVSAYVFLNEAGTRPEADLGWYFEFLDEVKAPYPSLKEIKSVVELQSRTLTPATMLWLAGRYGGLTKASVASAESESSSSSTRSGITVRSGKLDSDVASLIVQAGLAQGLLDLVVKALPALGPAGSTPVPTPLNTPSVAAGEDYSFTAAADWNSPWRRSLSERWQACADKGENEWLEYDDVGKWTLEALELALDRKRWDAASDIIANAEPATFRAVLLDRSGEALVRNALVQTRASFAKTYKAVFTDNFELGRVAAGLGAPEEPTSFDSDFLELPSLQNRNARSSQGEELLTESLALVALGHATSRLSGMLGQGPEAAAFVNEAALRSLIVGVATGTRLPQALGERKLSDYYGALISVAYSLASRGGAAHVEEAVARLPSRLFDVKALALECAVLGASDAGDIDAAVRLLGDFSPVALIAAMRPDASAGTVHPSCGESPVLAVVCEELLRYRSAHSLDRSAQEARASLIVSNVVSDLDREIVLLARVLAERYKALGGGEDFEARLLGWIRQTLLGERTLSVPSSQAIPWTSWSARSPEPPARTARLESEVPTAERQSVFEKRVEQLIRENNLGEAMELISVFDLQDSDPHLTQMVVSAAISGPSHAARVASMSSILGSRSNVGFKRQALVEAMARAPALFEGSSHPDVSKEIRESAQVLLAWRHAHACAGVRLREALDSPVVARSKAIETATQVLPLVAACRGAG